MAKVQNWSIPIDGDTYKIEYSYSPWTGDMKVVINDEEFVIENPIKMFRLFLGKKETIKLGDELCILVISKFFKADIVFRGKYIDSGLPYESEKTA